LASLLLFLWFIGDFPVFLSLVGLVWMEGWRQGFSFSERGESLVFFFFFFGGVAGGE